MASRERAALAERLHGFMQYASCTESPIVHRRQRDTRRLNHETQMIIIQLSVVVTTLHFTRWNKRELEHQIRRHF